jgi:glycosyltransferase 2 family protein
MSEPGSPSSSAPPRRLWGRLIRVVLVVAAVSLGIYAITRDPDSFTSAVAAVGFPRTAAAFVLVVTGLLASAEAWRGCIAAVAGQLTARQGRRVFFISQLGKYLPGAVWTVLAQVDAAKDHGLSRPRMGVGALLFLAIHLLTGLVVAAVLVPWAAPDAFTAYWWTFAAAPLFVIALMPPVLTALVDLALRLLRRDRLPRRLTTRDVVAPSLWMAVTWVFFGAAGFVIAYPLAEGTSVVELAAAATGAFALGWVVGLLVVPAPAGLGARDVVLYLALAPLLGAAGALSFTIILRVVHTAGDLALAGAAAPAWPRLSIRGLNRIRSRS